MPRYKSKSEQAYESVLLSADATPSQKLQAAKSLDRIRKQRAKSRPAKETTVRGVDWNGRHDLDTKQGWENWREDARAARDGKCPICGQYNFGGAPNCDICDWAKKYLDPPPPKLCKCGSPLDRDDAFACPPCREKAIVPCPVCGTREAGCTAYYGACGKCWRAGKAPQQRSA